MENLLNRLEILEKAVAQTSSEQRVAAQAINRAEVYLFSLIKSLLDNKVLTWEQLQANMDALTKAKDILEFFGVKPVEVTEAPPAS